MPVSPDRSSNILYFRPRGAVSETSQQSRQDTVDKPEERLLTEFGLNLDDEIKGLVRRFREEKARGLSPKEAKIRPIDEVITNSKKVHEEYSLLLSVLPKHEAIKNGHLTNSVTGYRIVDMITPQERGGNVLIGWRKSDTFLATAQPGDVALTLSPPGPTEFYHPETGEEHFYDDLQLSATMVNPDGSLSGITYIVSNFPLDKCINLYKGFQEPEKGIFDDDLSEREKVYNMVQAPIFLTGGKTNFLGILDKIQAIKGGEMMRAVGERERTFTEARELIPRIEEINFLPEKCMRYLDKLRGYLDETLEYSDHPQVYQAIRQRIKITYLEIADTILGKKESDVFTESMVFHQAFMGNNINLISDTLVNNTYDQAMTMLSQIPGCLGKRKDGASGQSIEIVSSSGREIVASGGSVLSSDQEGGGVCTKCGETNLCTKRCYKCNGVLKKGEIVAQAGSHLAKAA